MIKPVLAPTVRLSAPPPRAAAPPPDSPVDRFEPGFASLLAQAGTPYLDEVAERKQTNTYYSGLKLDGASPQEAYRQLSELVSSTHTQRLDYKPRQFLYPWTDLQPSLRLKSVYSPDPVAMDAPARGNKRHQVAGMVTALLAGPADTPTLATRIALMESRGDMNCEHVVPKIWFDDEGVPTGDLHHLFASDSLTNVERTNRKLTELETHEFPAHSGEGWTTPGGDEFEPAGGKGEMARATLYFLLRYPGKIGDAPGEYTPKDLVTLLKWHRENPVTLHERHRNQEISRLQGNRNPLIDHPEWAERVDFGQGLGELRK